MRIKRSVKPGQPGAKKLTERYGEKLVCVRYRYDDDAKRAIKTVELIIEDLPWHPNAEKIPSNKIMNLRIAVNETGLRQNVKSAGGTWNPVEQAWRLPYKKVTELGLVNRIVKKD